MLSFNTQHSTLNIDSLGSLTFPLIGNSLVVGVFALLHIAFAGLAVGYMILAPLAEAFGRTDPFLTDAAKTMTRFTVITYTASLVLAVIMIDLFIGLFPLTNSWLFNQFRYPVFAAIAAFLIQLFALYPYYHYWDAIRARSIRLHIVLGAVTAVFVLVWVMILDGIGSYMLTPVDRNGSWTNMLNPTWLPLVVHRFGGNLVLAGYVMAGYAAWRITRARSGEDESYYLSLFKGGVIVGLLSLLLQPVTGLWYAASIESAAPDAYTQLIRGPYQGFVYAQFLLVGVLFLGSHLLLRPAGASGSRQRWAEAALLAAVALMVAFVGYPGIRRLFTFLVVTLTVWFLYTWGQAFLNAGREKLKPALTRGISLLLAGTSLMTYVTMGTIRETARRPDTVRGVISLQDEAKTPAAYRNK